MRIPRIFTHQPLAIDCRVILEPEASHHLSQVLRLKLGDALVLFNGNGEEYAAEVTELAKKNVCVGIREFLRAETSPPLGINLIIGISRGERMEFALQKAVELGVTEVQPIFTKRCMVKLDGQRLPRRLAHWQKILVSACEQSGRNTLPHLFNPAPLADALLHDWKGLRLLLDHRGQLTLPELSRPDQTVNLLIGPEGGLNAEERKMAGSHDFIGIKLGPRVLRSETAPLAAMAAIQVLWGDFRP